MSNTFFIDNFNAGILHLKPNSGRASNEVILGNPHDTDNNESHQKKAICYCRNEDDRFIKMIEVDLYTGEVKMSLVENDMSKNPSWRRQAVSIKIETEGDGKEFYINISQHKGNTYLGIQK